MKQAEVKALSTEELEDKIAHFKSACQQLKLTHAVTPIENPMQLRMQRRALARLATELRKRQLERD